MPNIQDLCPNQSDGNHRYFVFKTAEVFVPISADSAEAVMHNSTLYEKKEMAILGCNCGSVTKSEVKQS